MRVPDTAAVTTPEAFIGEAAFMQAGEASTGAAQSSQGAEALSLAGAMPDALAGLGAAKFTQIAVRTRCNRGGIRRRGAGAGVAE